jgi:uncharacterized membrane protein SpoIIM required for sporulation
MMQKLIGIHISTEQYTLATYQVMNVQRWLARRAEKWQELEVLLQRAEGRGVKSLTALEISNLASLYRSIAADLARAQTNQISPSIIAELQALTSRAYSQVYRGSNRQEAAGILRFYTEELPQVIRETWIYTAIALGIFLVGGLIAWWFAWQDPNFLALIVPQSMIEKVRDKHELWMGSILGTEPLAASGIMINNLSVCFRAVAGGIAASLITVIIMFLNGVLIGGAAALVSQNDLAYPFWAFVFPHGSLELPAIFISGGAGLLIGRGLVFPGQYRRRDALRIYGLQAAKLVMGIVPMLFMAGIIEGFFSPQEVIPSVFKYLVGTGIFIIFIFYCLRNSWNKIPETLVIQQKDQN